MAITKAEIDFLRESNNIEDEWDDVSLAQSIFAWEYLKKQKTISPSVVFKTHKILMLHHNLRPNEKGYLRQCPIYIGGREGKPWQYLPELVAQWCEVINSSEDWKQTHIEYENIHPFVDGNGRTGRMFLNWQRLKLGLPILIIKNDKKWDYYKWF